jgi:hypothetical protein
VIFLSVVVIFLSVVVIFLSVVVIFLSVAVIFLSVAVIFLAVAVISTEHHQAVDCCDLMAGDRVPASLRDHGVVFPAAVLPAAVHHEVVHPAEVHPAEVHLEVVHRFACCRFGHECRPLPSRHACAAGKDERHQEVDQDVHRESQSGHGGGRGSGCGSVRCCRCCRCWAGGSENDVFCPLFFYILVLRLFSILFFFSGEDEEECVSLSVSRGVFGDGGLSVTEWVGSFHGQQLQE